MGTNASNVSNSNYYSQNGLLEKNDAYILLGVYGGAALMVVGFWICQILKERRDADAAVAQQNQPLQPNGPVRIFPILHEPE